MIGSNVLTKSAPAGGPGERLPTFSAGPSRSQTLAEVLHVKIDFRQEGPHIVQTLFSRYAKAFC
jgi:hypothetical protein